MARTDGAVRLVKGRTARFAGGEAMNIADMPIGEKRHVVLAYRVLAVVYRSDEGWSLYVGVEPSQHYEKEWPKAITGFDKQAEPVARAIVATLFLTLDAGDLRYA